MALTRFAVLFATSFADCTKCLFATGLDVFDDAVRQVLHNAEVCLATTVAADNTWKRRLDVSTETPSGRIGTRMTETPRGKIGTNTLNTTQQFCLFVEVFFQI